MDETERIQRNNAKLLELYPFIRPKVLMAIQEMERAGFRPVIREAWRTPEAQMAAYRAGTSKLKYGFHNVTAADGTKESLAADIWDVDHPEEPTRPYMLHLAAAALRNGLISGAFFDLTTAQVSALYKALVDMDWNAPVAIGWDPCHVQATGLTVADAKGGKRPGDAPLAAAVQPAAQPVDGTATAGNTAASPVEKPAAGPATGSPPAAAPALTLPAAPPISTSASAPLKRHFHLTEQETGRTSDLELDTPLRPAALLAVPWVSQLGPGADKHSRDCSAACAAMLLRAYLGLVITPDDFFARYAMPDDDYLKVPQVRNALVSLGLPAEARVGLSLADLFNFLLAGKPVMVMLHYRPLHAAGLTEAAFDGPHSAVAVGIDRRFIYLNDPLYAQAVDGEAHAYPLEVFLKAWKETSMDTALRLPERSAIVPSAALGTAPGASLPNAVGQPTGPR